MNKDEIRKVFQQKREKLSQEESEKLSEQLCRQFFRNVPLQGIRHLHIFLPIAHQKEVNTWLIIRHLQENYPRVGVVVSRTNWKSRRMDNFHLLPDTIIKESALGIPEPEPVEESLCPVEKIDLVLLPLLAFDLKGNRVGYGAGFYDRFLSGCQPQARKIGLSFFGPLPENINDVNQHDIPMDACICPDQIYYFNDSFKP